VLLCQFLAKQWQDMCLGGLWQAIFLIGLWQEIFLGGLWREVFLGGLRQENAWIICFICSVKERKCASFTNEIANLTFGTPSHGKPLMEE
jgi:hypothetical protein